MHDIACKLSYKNATFGANGKSYQQNKVMGTRSKGKWLQMCKHISPDSLSGQA